MSLIYAITSGLLLASAFPKSNFSIIAWVALVPFFFAIEKSKNTREAAALGFTLGMTLFSINFLWINSLSLYVGKWAYLAWICLAIFQSIFLLIYSYIIKRFNITLSIWGAFLWILIEIIRGMGNFGMPGGVIAYSQTIFLPIIQIASFTTAYGISFLIILFNISLTKIIFQKNKKGTLSLFLLSLILIFASTIYGFIQLNKPINNKNTIKIASIQGNIPQEKKLDPDFNTENLNIHKKLTLKAAKEAPDIIIWPETSIPVYLLHNKKFLNEIKNLAKETNSYLIIGTPHYDKNHKIYNSMAVISPSFEVVSRYDKQQLVPFGEYLPFRFFLYPFLKNTGYYEGEFARGNGDITIIITNDAWFKTSSAPYEHFNHAIFRAIENRKFVVQAANTGISGLIDPCGRVIKKLGLNKKGYLVFNPNY